MKRRVKKKIKVVGRIFIIGLIIIIGILIGINYKQEEVKFSLKGSNIVKLNLGEKYQEAGYEAIACGKKCHNITNVTIDNDIDVNKVGIKEVIYKLKYHGKSYELKRTVEVRDPVAPTITLKKGNFNSCLDNYEAYDNYDLDLTDKVNIKDEEKVREYTVMDSSGNMSLVKRTNASENTIQINGKNTLYLEVGEKYQEQGVMVSDNCLNNLTLNIEGYVDTSKTGTYKITYRLANEKNDNIFAERTVKVYDFKTSDPDEYWESLGYYINAKGYNMSLGYKNLDKQITYKYNENKVYYGASLIKTLGALYSYEFLDVDNNSDLKYWVSIAISESSNAAHKNIVNLIGVNKLREYGKSLGATKVLDRGIATDYFGNTWVNDQLIYMEYLYNFVQSNPKGEELKSYFINDHYNKVKLANGPVVMHKYGYYDKYFHESAIMLDSSPYIITILSEEAKRVVTDDNNIFADISAKLYDLNNLVKSES